jgi:6-phosphogluconolactonase
MRMKFNKSGQLVLVSAASLLVAGLITACSTLTVDFVFVTSSKAAGANNFGEVDVFEVNSESGAMRQIPTSPFPSGGRNPVAEAVSSDNTNLYVVNHDDNSIVQFIIGNDGKLYPQNTVNTPGIFPMAVSVNGKNLFVVDTYQPLPICSTAHPCSGSVAVYPIAPSASSPPSDVLGMPIANGNLNYWPLAVPGKPNDVVVPTAISILPSGDEVFVTAYDSSISPSVGYVFAFTNSSGVLAPVNGGVPFTAGILPSAITTDSTGQYVYVTDSISNNVLAYTIQSDLLTPISGSPFPSGDQPSGITVDPAGSFAFVSNALDSTVTVYTVSSGALTRTATFATGLQPIAIGIDPSKKHFLYTANFLGGTLSGFELSSSNGPLLNSQGSPYTSNAQPTAIAAIPHGSQTK